MNTKEKAPTSAATLTGAAAEIGLNDGNFSRRLRYELPTTEKQKILEIINRLATERSD